jgi:outer membrane immunogenic protein
MYICNTFSHGNVVEEIILFVEDGMKNTPLVICAAMFAATPVLAADLPARTGPPAAPFAATVPAFTWTGFYIGANAGYVGGTGRVSVTGLGSESGRYDGFIGGGQVGYNWQTGQLVLGIEADLNASGIEYSESAFGITAKSRLDYLGTVRGRVGMSFNSIMPYVTAGIAYGQNSISGSGFGVAIRDRQTHVGWAVGAGVEAQLGSGWSVKGEYLYVDLGRETYFSNVAGGFQARADFHTARLGLNYRF